MISSKLEDETASALAIDAGLMYNELRFMGRELKTGVVVRNIGSKMKFINEEDALPLLIGAGSSCKLTNNFTMAFDINLPSDNDMNAHLGGEYIYKNVALRMGYKTTGVKDFDAISGLSLGMGFRWKEYSVDYAWGSYGDLASSHRLSINFRFGGAGC